MCDSCASIEDIGITGQQAADMLDSLANDLIHSYGPPAQPEESDRAQLVMTGVYCVIRDIQRRADEYRVQ